jgi:hypothetical protein
MASGETPADGWLRRRVKRRFRRFLVIAPLFALVLAGLTFFEQRRLAEALPGHASGGAGDAAVSASAAVAEEPRLDAARLMADVGELASPQLEGRLTGSPGGARARAMIVGRFRTIGLTEPPAFTGYLQPFTFTHTSVKALWRQDRPFRKDFTGANIVGFIPPRAAAADATRSGNVAGATAPSTTAGGSPSATTMTSASASASASASGSAAAAAAPAAAGRYILLSAHYDHLGVRGGHIYPGADDNASGVAALLGIAAYLRQHPLSRGVIIAAFDGEEEGLRGAAAFVEHPPVPLDAIDVAVNMDMISRSATSDITIAGLYHWPALAPIVSRAAAASGASSIHVHLGHDHPFWRAGLVEDWTHASDQGPFHDAGVPFLYVGVEDHEDYHRPTDTADRIDPRFYAATADLVLQLLEAIDRDPAASFRRPPPAAVRQ